MTLQRTGLVSTLLLTGTLLGLTAGCATAVPPTQLVEVRNAFAVSQSSAAATVAPTELYDARKVLEQANAEFDKNGDTLACRDYVYIAQRKLTLVDVKARTELDRRRIAEAVKAGVVVRDTQVKNTQVALADTREQLKEERRDSNTTAKELRAANSAQGVDLQKANAQIELEKAGRATAEAKLAGAMKDLATIAAVKEETRGMVITLSGSVLFASGKFALLETAMTKLDQVAEALKAQDGDKRMVVEGHTDNQGSDRTNQPLSLNRATSVRDYLVSRGVDAGKISSVGMSSTRPITDNRTAENRANNRRVEIIISPVKVSSL